MAPKFEQAVATVQNTVAQSRAQAESLIAFGKGNVEAFVQSGQIWTAGVQELSRELAANAQAQLTATVDNAKAVATVKSAKEFLDLQTAFARSSVETAVAQSTKLANATKKLAEDALAPLVARGKLATETFGRAA